jgi:hypothetical protein
MDVNEILQQLMEERDRLDEAIIAIERLAAERTTRRGRPPNWLVEERAGKRSAEGGKPSRGRKRSAKKRI